MLNTLLRHLIVVLLLGPFFTVHATPPEPPAHPPIRPEAHAMEPPSPADTTHDIAAFLAALHAPDITALAGSGGVDSIDFAEGGIALGADGMELAGAGIGLEGDVVGITGEPLAGESSIFGADLAAETGDFSSDYLAVLEEGRTSPDLNLEDLLMPHSPHPHADFQHASTAMQELHGTTSHTTVGSDAAEVDRLLAPPSPLSALAERDATPPPSSDSPLPEMLAPAPLALPTPDAPLQRNLLPERAVHPTDCTAALCLSARDFGRSHGL